MGRSRSILDGAGTSGLLYGASSSLRIINPADGSFTAVGSIDSASETSILMKSIAFDPDGNLYGISNSDVTLYTIDKSTAFATAVGTVPVFTWELDFAPDGTLYSAFADLITLDPATAQVVSTIGALGTFVVDIDFAPNGSIYGVYYDTQQLYEIDPASASTTLLGTYLSSTWGVASLPVGSPLQGPSQHDFNDDGGQATAIHDEQALTSSLLHAANNVTNTGTLQHVENSDGVWVIELDPGEIVEDIDFGNHETGDTGEIHGQKWNDLDGDGGRDPGEAGLPGWTIFVDDNLNGMLDEGELFDVTGSDGFYAITNVPPGSHVVAEISQDGWEQTFPVGSGADFRFLSGTGSEGTHDFSLLELQTDPAAEVLIGPAGLNFGLDFDPITGLLYGASSSLRVIDPTDGTVTTIGAISSANDPSISMSGISFAPNGTLYGLSPSTDKLYVIDKNSAFATEVGEVSPTVWGIEFAPDGTLYAAFAELFILDPTTGQTLRTIGRLEDIVVELDFAPDGSLYGIDNEAPVGELYEINTGDGNATLLATYGSGTWSLASETNGVDGLTHRVIVNQGEIVEDVDFGNHSTSSRDLVVDLPSGSGANDVTLRRNGLNVEVFDNNTGTVIATRLLAETDSVTINGTNVEDDALTVDYAFGGFFALSGGVWFDGGSGAGDGVTILGDGLTTGRFVSNDTTLANARIDTSRGGQHDPVNVAGIESLTIDQFGAFEVAGELHVVDLSFFITALGYTPLGFFTTIDGGTISAANGLLIGAGDRLSGQGTIDAAIVAELGSTISLTGNLTIGDALAFDGFVSNGRVNIGDNTLALLDGHKALLGSQTTLGADGNDGTLDADQGVALQDNRTLVGSIPSTASSRIRASCRAMAAASRSTISSRARATSAARSLSSADTSPAIARHRSTCWVTSSMAPPTCSRWKSAG